MYIYIRVSHSQTDTTERERERERGEMEERRRWEDLPLDCLVNVFQRLGLEDKTEGVPLVCRSWHEASLNRLCWQSVSLALLDSQFLRRRNHIPGKSSYMGLLRFLVDRNRGSAVKIIFPDYTIRLEEVAYFTERCPMLECLALPRIDDRDEDRLPQLVPGLRNLRRLYMRYKPSSFGPFVEQVRRHCENLVGFQVCGILEEQDMATIAALLPGLRYLCVSGSVVSRASLRLVLTGCAQLEELYAEECRGFYVDAEMAGQASHLKAFEFHGSRPCEDDYFSDDSLESDEIWERIFGRRVWCGGGDDEVLIRVFDLD